MICKTSIEEGMIKNGVHYTLIKKKEFKEKIGVLVIGLGYINCKYSIYGEMFTIKENTVKLLEQVLKIENEEYYKTIHKELNSCINISASYTKITITFKTINEFRQCLKIVVKSINRRKTLVESVKEKEKKKKNLKESKMKLLEIEKNIKDNPKILVTRNMLKCMFNNFPEEKQENIKSITIDDIEKIYNYFFNVTNIKFIGVGDIDKKILREELGKIKYLGKKPLVNKYLPKEKKVVKKNYIISEGLVDKEIFSIGFKIEIKEKFSDKIIYKILFLILFGNSSDFYEIVYLKGLVGDDFKVKFSNYKTLGVGYLEGSSFNSKQLLNEIIIEIKKNKINKITFEKFVRIKNKIKFEYLMDCDNLTFIAKEQSIMCFDENKSQSNLGYCDNYLYELEKITLEDVNNALMELTVDNKYVHSIVH